MFYSVLVVEDETLLRKLFLQNIRWETFQCRVVFDCESAEKAVDYVKENGFPDILITDIRLLQMSGIDLCRYFQEHSPGTKKAILSGYGDFDYAKQAIEYAVNEYLLKPVEPREIEKVLRRFTHELFILRHNEQELAGIRALVHKNRRHHIENMLAELAGGVAQYGEKDIQERTQELDFSLGKYVYLVVKYRQRADTPDQLPVSLQLKEFLREQFSFFGDCYLFSLEHHRICCVFLPVNNGQNPEEMLKSTFAKIPLFNTNLLVSAGLSLPQTGLKTVRKAHEQAQSACDHDFYFGVGSIITFQPVFNRQIDIPIYLDDLGNDRIVAQLLVGNWEEAAALLSQRLETVKDEQMATVSMLQSAAIDLTTAIYRKIYALNPEYPSPDLSEDVWRITSATTVNEIEGVLESIIRRCGENVQRNFLHHTHEAVATILDYIQQNYNRQITLDELSQLVYLNTKYICTIIKKDTGKTFHEILTDIRVMKAKEILRDSTIKMYQISQQTGFYDTKAFNGAFKKITGLTPTQYRRKLQGTP